MLLLLKTPAIWVNNPYTGQPVNVAPLFDASNQFADELSGNGLQQAVSHTLKHINLTGCDESGKLIALNYDLYRLEELFGCLFKAPPTPPTPE